MKCNALIPLAALSLGSCVTSQVRQAGSVETRLGQMVSLGGPRVTPLKVLEDSRCPMEARCVWAGQVRLQVRVRLGSHSELRELTQGKPDAVADGQLILTDVRPSRSTRHPLLASDYRFVFSFAGGL